MPECGWIDLDNFEELQRELDREEYFRRHGIYPDKGPQIILLFYILHSEGSICVSDSLFL